MAQIFRRGLAAAMALALAGAPAAAQQYSNGYNFIKAVKERDPTKVTELVSEPGSTVINARDGDTGEGALHILVRGRDYTWLSFMLGKRARPDLQNSQGETALNLAAQISWLEGAELLLNHGATVDLANNRGETPLIMAVHRRDLAMVRLLLNHGANPRKADRSAGYSALDYAKQDTRSPAILRVLEASLAPAAGAAAGPRP